MSEHNSDPPDSPSYVPDVEASQIIRDTLAEYDAELKSNHSKSPSNSFLRSGSGSFVFTSGVPEVTPSSAGNTLTPDAKRDFTINKGKKENSDNEDDEESVTSYYLPRVERKLKRREKRRKETEAVAVSSFSSTHYDKKMKSVDDAIHIKQEIKKPGRATVSVPSDRIKQQRPPNEIKVISNNSVSSSPLYINPNPTAADYEVCLHCKSRKYMCHDVRYRKYCLQAANDYLQCNTHGWLSGFSPARMESVFASAYNEIRRIDIYQSFGYYHSGYLRIPKCMELNSMQEAVDLGYTPALGRMLEKENAEGKESYFRSQRCNNH